MIVATASGVQLATRVANQLDQSRFDKRVDVLDLRIIAATLIEDGFQGVTDLSSFARADYTRVFECLTVRDACPDVGLEQPPIEAKGIVEGREARISFASPLIMRSSMSSTREVCSRATLVAVASDERAFDRPALRSRALTNLPCEPGIGCGDQRFGTRAHPGPAPCRPDDE